MRRAATCSNRPLAPSASTSGHQVRPSPYGRQRPAATVAAPLSASVTSATSRDLPTPAAPRTVSSSHERSLDRLLERVEQLPALALAADHRRALALRAPAASDATESNRKAASAAALPLTANGAIGSAWTAWRTSR